MKNLRKLFAIVMIFAIALAFSACGESGKVDSAQTAVDDFFKAVKKTDFETVVTLTANGTDINSSMIELKDFFETDNFFSFSQEIPDGCEDTLKKYSEDVAKLISVPFTKIEYTVNESNPGEEIVVIKVNTNFLLSDLQYSNIQKLFADSYTDRITNLTEKELADVKAMSEKDSFLFTSKIAYETYEKLFDTLTKKVESTKIDLAFYVQKLDNEWKIIEIK